MKLQEIIKEIERIGDLYRNSENEDIRKSYEQHIELVILNEAEKSQQYDLNDYWERLIQ